MTSTPQPTQKDFDQMMQMLMGSWLTQIAGAVGAYSIADHLAQGPATADEIAAREGIDPSATFRLLRACASLGLVTYDGKRFAGTSMLGTLRSDLPGSLHSLAITFSASGHWQPWGSFAAAVRTNSPQTIPTLGTSIWEYLKKHPDESAVFTRAMHGFTSGISEEVARVLDTANTKLAVDVGGASGTLVHSLLGVNPHLRGIVFDLPEIVHSAEITARELGLENRSTAVAGNFFEHVPEADLYLLKHVLHDWSDSESIAILKRCRASIRPGGRVVLVEILLGEIGEPSFGPLMDLNMMVMLTGRERTLSEYRGLLEQAGFEFSKVTPIRTRMAVIEATA